MSDSIEMQRNLDLRYVEAIIFDLDGTMVDNTPFHKRAWKRLLQQYEIQITDDDFDTRIFGHSTADILSSYFPSASATDILAFTAQKDDLYRHEYKDHVVARPGLIDFITMTKNHDKKLAVATTSNTANREFILAALGLKNTFNAVVGGEHVGKHKPDPEVYTLTRDVLNVPSQQCLVFEDTQVGVDAARGAGMRVIAIVDHTIPVLINGADLTIADFRELSPKF